MRARRSSTTSRRCRAIRPCCRWRSKRAAASAPCTCGARRKPCKTSPTYADVVAEVTSYLRDRRDALLAAGVTQDRIALDPGIGFGKTTQHNLQLLANAWRLHALGCPVLVGHSRKRFLAEAGGQTVRVAVALPPRRDSATAAPTTIPRRPFLVPCPRSDGRHHRRGTVVGPAGGADSPRPRRGGRPPGPAAVSSHRRAGMKPEPLGAISGRAFSSDKRDDSTADFADSPR